MREKLLSYGKVICLVLIMGVSFSVRNSYAQEEIRVSVDGEYIDFSEYDNVYPKIVEGRTLVPMRAIFEKLKFEVEYDVNTNIAIGRNDDLRIELPIGRKDAKVNGQKIALDVVADVINGRTMIPVRFVAEKSGANVSWNAENRVVIIESKGSHGNFGTILREEYKVYSYDVRDLDTILKEGVESDISFPLTDNSFDISPENLYIEWNGVVVVDRNTTLAIERRQGLTRGRLTINGEYVPRDTYDFKKGDNTIKVELVNKNSGAINVFHDTEKDKDFFIKFKNVRYDEKKESLKKTLENIIEDDTKVLFVGAYESYEDTNNVNLDMLEQDTSTILFISSYNPIEWNITGAKKANLKAVIYNRSIYGSKVKVDDKRVNLIQYEGIYPMTSLYPQYRENSGSFDISNNEYERVKEGIEQITGKDIAGITIEYGLDDASVPQTILTQELKAEIEQKYMNMYEVRDNIEKLIWKEWGDEINAEDLPTNKYKVLYYKSDDLSEVVTEEEMDKVSLNFSWEYKGIKSENLSARWIGNLYFDEDTTKQVYISEGWKEVKLKINDRFIDSDEYRFKKGFNKVEVFFTNRWHTGDVQVKFMDGVKVATTSEIKNILESKVTENTKVYIVDLYSTSNKSNEVELNLIGKDEEAVICVNSYETIDWIINNPNNTKIIAVILNSHEGGSEIILDDTDNPLILKNPQFYGKRHEAFKLTGKVVDMYFEKSSEESIDLISE